MKKYSTEKILKIVAVAIAAAYIVLYVVLAVLRISYPFELEWQEGSMVDHVQRVLAGLPLYTPPSIEWVPAIYPPLYYYVAAGVSLIMGGGFLPLRLLSLVASLGCMGILYNFVRRETQDRVAGLLAAGLFAAVYRLTGAWLDLARVDSLFLLFVLGAIWMLRFQRTRIGFALAAVLTAAAVFTKQTALFAALFMVVYALRRRREGGWFFIFPVLILLSLGAAVLESQSDGWFNFYVLAVPAGHNLIGPAIVEFWVHDLLQSLAVAVMLGAVFLLRDGSREARDGRWFYLLMGAGLAATSWLPRVKDGNYVNDLLPVYAFVALLFGLAIPAVRAWGREFLEAVAENHPERARWKSALSSLLWLAVVVQFAVLYYRPWEQIPTVADRAAGESLLQTIRQTPGEVWVGHHGYLAAQAGKQTLATALPIYDILRCKNERAKNLLLDSIEHALKQQRFAAIVVDNDRFVNLNEYAEYERKSGVFSDPAVFWPVSGVPTRPLRIFGPVKKG
jgi:hypothetical protein